MSEAKTTICLLCLKEHETISMYGMIFVPCPEMPENLIMPSPTLEAFMAGRSMLDAPLIVVK